MGPGNAGPRSGGPSTAARRRPAGIRRRAPRSAAAWPTRPDRISAPRPTRARYIPRIANKSLSSHRATPGCVVGLVDPVWRRPCKRSRVRHPRLSERAHRLHLRALRRLRAPFVERKRLVDADEPPSDDRLKRGRRAEIRRGSLMGAVNGDQGAHALVSCTPILDHLAGRYPACRVREGRLPLTRTSR